MRRSEAVHWAVRTWPDGAVLFDRRNGSTHALNPVTASVLEMLSCDSPPSNEALYAQIEQRFPELTSTEVRQVVDDAVATLTRHTLA